MKRLPHKDDIYNIKPETITTAATIITLANVFSSNFGRKEYYGPYDSIDGGIIMIVFVMIYPLFVKGFRKNFWSKKGLRTFIIALIVNVVIVLLCLYGGGHIS